MWLFQNDNSNLITLIYVETISKNEVPYTRENGPITKTLTLKTPNMQIPNFKPKILIAPCQFPPRSSPNPKVDNRGVPGEGHENRQWPVYIGMNTACPLCQSLVALSGMRFPARNNGWKADNVRKTEGVYRVPSSVTTNPLSALLFFLPLVSHPFPPFFPLSLLLFPPRRHGENITEVDCIAGHRKTREQRGA